MSVPDLQFLTGNDYTGDRSKVTPINAARSSYDFRGNTPDLLDRFNTIPSTAVEDEGNDNGSAILEALRNYRGVNLENSLYSLGRSFKYDGDKKGLNLFRGITSGLGAALNIGRNVASGMAYQNMQNQQDRYYREQMRDYLNQLQYVKEGGKVTQEKIATGKYITENPEEEVANIEAEAGEYIKQPNLEDVQKIIGKKHSQGGEKLNVEPESKVLSDFTELGGKLARQLSKELDVKLYASNTFADVLDKYSKKIGLQKLVDEEVELIEKLGKQSKVKSEVTRQINQRFLANKISEIQEKQAPLLQQQEDKMEYLFNLQESLKEPSEVDEILNETDEEDIALIQSMVSELGIPEEVAQDTLREMKEGGYVLPKYQEGNPPKVGECAAGDIPCQTRLLKAQVTKEKFDEYMKEAKGTAQQKLNYVATRYRQSLDNEMKRVYAKGALPTTASIKEWHQSVKGVETDADKEFIKVLESEGIIRDGKVVSGNYSIKDKAKRSEVTNLFRTRVDALPKEKQYKIYNKIVDDGLYQFRNPVSDAKTFDSEKEMQDYIDAGNYEKVTYTDGKLRYFDKGDNATFYDFSYKTPEQNDAVTETETETVIGDRSGAVQDEIDTKKKGKDKKTDRKELINNLKSKLKNLVPKSTDDIDLPLYTPSQYKLPPEGVRPHAKFSVNYGTIDPMVVDSGQARQQLTDVFTTTVKGVQDKVDSQNKAALLNLAASMSKGINDAEGRVHQINTQNRYNADNYNIQIKNQEQNINNQLAQNFETLNYRALANTQRDLQNYFDYNMLLDMQNFRDRLNRKNIDERYENTSITSTGEVHSDKIDVEHLANILSKKLRLNDTTIKTKPETKK